jgi:PAS domain S-box-containing protein
MVEPSSEKREQQRWRQFLAASPAVIYSMDASPPHALNFVSDNIANKLGYSVEECLQDPHFWYRSIHPEDFSQVVGSWNGETPPQQVPPIKPKSGTQEYRLRHRDGSYSWIRDEWQTVNDEDGNQSEIIGSWLPIECPSQISEICQNCSHMEATGKFFQLSLDLFCVLNFQGEFLQVNPAVTRILGYTPEEFCQKSLPDSIHPDDLEETNNKGRELVEKQTLTTFENRYQHVDGSYRWLSWSAIAVPEEQVIYAIARDITKDKEIEKAKDRLEALAEATTDFVGICDAAGHPFYINTAGRRMLAIAPEEDISQDHIGDYYAPQVRQTAFETAIPTAEQQQVWHGESEFMDRNGNIIPVSQVITAHKDQQGNIEFYATIARDIRDRKQIEHSLRWQEQQLRQKAQKEALLNQINNQIRQSLDIDTVLETAVRSIHELLQVDRCAFLWYEPGDGESHPIWNCVKESKSPEKASKIGVYPVDSDNFLTQQCLQLKIVQIDDFHEIEAKLTPSMQQMRDRWNMRAVLVVPTITQEGKIGIMGCIQEDQPRTWQVWETEILLSVCDCLNIAISQATLYQKSQEAANVASQHALQLEHTLNELQRTQTQLIHNEKMAGLGQLVAGIAHEINNPVNFIYGNVNHAQEYTDELIGWLQHYQQRDPEMENQDGEAVGSDLDFIIEDFPKLIQSMQVGAERIRDIVQSLRTFSRLDEADWKEVDLHEGVESTLTILHHRLTEKRDRPAIEIVRNYGELPAVGCYANQLNQVFANLLTNSIDALEMACKQNQQDSLRIWIATRLVDDFVEIDIADNGMGMTEEVQKRLFDPFFTTKPVGRGTGLGLSIAYQIITERHQGELQYSSSVGEGTTFTIRIPLQQQPQHSSNNNESSPS